jgi:hypothetical protein
MSRVHVVIRRGRTFDRDLCPELSASGPRRPKEQENMSKKAKRYLMLLVAVGLIAVAAGGSGTFATFSAETANNNNFFATGTLFLHATANATTCTSEAATDNINVTNVGGGCNALFSVALTSGTATQYAHLVLKNAGTLPADGIKFYSPAPGCQSAAQLRTNTTLSADVTIAGGAITALPVNALTYGLQLGATVTLDNGTNTDTFVTSAAVPSGATTIPIVSDTPAFDFLAATPTNVKSAPSFGNGDLCTGLQVAIVETTATPGYANAVECAYGNDAGSTCTFSTTPNLGTLPSSPLGLNLFSGGGTGNAALGLDAGGTRYFTIAVQPPSVVGLDNTYQNKKATFNLRWKIDQA